MVACNQFFLEFYGIATAPGANWSLLIHPDHRQRVLAECLHATMLRLPFAWEAPARRYDGAYRLVAVQGIPLSDGHTAGTGVDVTELREAQGLRRLIPPPDRLPVAAESTLTVQDVALFSIVNHVRW